MRVVARAYLIAIAMSTSMWTQLPAQAGSSSYGTLRDSLLAITVKDSLPARAQETDHVRTALVAWRAGQISGDRGEYDRSLSLLETVLRRGPQRPELWFLVGLIREDMGTRGFAVKETSLHPAGLSYRSASYEAWRRALLLDGDFLPAAQALGNGLKALGSRKLPKAFRDVIASESARLKTVPEIHLVAARYALQARRLDSAALAVERFSAAGGDSGVARLELSRVLAAQGRLAEAVSVYLRGTEGLTPVGQAAYRDDLAWVANDAELSAYDLIEPARVGATIRRFWEERDVVAIRGPGERLREHLRRWAYSHFNYLLERPDDAVAHEGNVQDSGDAFDAPSVAESIVLSDVTFAPSFKAYVRRQWELDDRGVIYMRHGEPTRKAFSVKGPPNESWQYDLPEGSRIFHFIASPSLGTLAATTLVAALPLRADMLDARGALDPRYVALASDLRAKTAQVASQMDTTPTWLYRPGSAATAVELAQRAERSGGIPAKLAPERYAREVEFGKKAIAAGIATDAFPRTFHSDLTAVVQVYGVGSKATTTGVLLVVFGVPGQNLAYASPGNGRPGVLYPVRFRIVALDKASKAVSQVDTVRTFLARDTLRGQQHLSGFLEVPVPPGVYTVRVLVMSSDTTAASSFGRDSVVVGRAAGALQLSDPILGTETSGLRWASEGTIVPLNPLNAYTHGMDATLLCRVSGMESGASYQMVLGLRRATDKPDAKPLLRLSSILTSDSSGIWIRRDLGLSKLKPGRYVLTVTLQPPAKGDPIEREQELNVLPDH